MYVHGTQCIDTIQRDAAKDMAEGREVALLVNNLGSTPAMEMYIMAWAALKYAQDKHKVQKSVWLHVGFVALLQGLTIHKATHVHGSFVCSQVMVLAVLQLLCIFSVCSICSACDCFMLICNLAVMQDCCAPETAETLRPLLSVSTRLQLRPQLSC